MTSAVNVLLVETDEFELHETAEQLSMDGHTVDAVGDVDEARSWLAGRPDALILGDEPQTIGLLRDLRGGEIPGADSRTPVLVLGADDDSAAVRYYRAGADVTLPSESSPLLVAAGLETLMRRVGPPDGRTLRIGSLTIDRDARTVHVDGRSVKLTRIEFDLLATLATDPRRTFPRDELTHEVWGHDPQAVAPTRTIDTHAHRVRRKLEQAGAEPMVQNVRGIGWRLSR
jgi:DNA-binding response OmpR family regulator